MKLNSKLKKGREREKSFHKSKNKDKHVKIVAEPTKREKQILNGETPDDYVNTKNNPMALIMRMSRHRQEKIARINEEYNKLMNSDNDDKLKNSQEKDKDIDKDKDKDEKINKEDKVKKEAQLQQEKPYKKKFKDNKIEKDTKKEKYFEKNKADKDDKDEEEKEKEKEKENENENENPINTKIENDNTRNNFKFRSRYFQRMNTEENKDIGNSKKVYQKREIKFRKPLMLEEKSNLNNSLNANKIIGNDRQILTDRPGYNENKKDDKLNDSINKRFFKLNKTRYFNRVENNKKPEIKNKIEKINNYSNKENSSFNKTNIREENNNDLNNDYYNNYNTEDQIKKNTNKGIISYQIQAEELKNNRSNNDIFNSNEDNNNNKEGEIKKTDTKVYVNQRPALIYDKEKILNTIDTILENDNNNPRKIKTRNVIRNNIYKREINDNIINKTEKDNQEENNDIKNNGSFTSRRRRYDVNSKIETETEYKEKDNQESNDILDKLEYRGTRNKKNSVINNYKTSYDNANVDRKEKVDLSVDNAPKISEVNESQDNSVIHSYRRKYQSITRGIKDKNDQNKTKNNDTSVDNILPKWRKKQVINIENQDKDKEKDYKAAIPFRRKFVNVTRSLDPVLKRDTKKENDNDINEKNNNEQQPKEKENIGKRYENVRINNYTKVERDGRNNNISKDKSDNEEVKRDEEQKEEEEGLERNRKRKRLRYQRYYNNINWKADNKKELNKSSDISTLRRGSNI